MAYHIVDTLSVCTENDETQYSPKGGLNQSKLLSLDLKGILATQHTRLSGANKINFEIFNMRNDAGLQKQATCVNTVLSVAVIRAMVKWVVWGVSADEVFAKARQCAKEKASRYPDIGGPALAQCEKLINDFRSKSPNITTDIVADATAILRNIWGADNLSEHEHEKEDLHRYIQVYDAVEFFKNNKIYPATLRIVTPENRLHAVTVYLSDDTLWSIQNEDELILGSTKNIFSLMINFVLLKQEGRDPFNRLTKIGIYVPDFADPRVIDMSELPPALYNNFCNMLYPH